MRCELGPISGRCGAWRGGPGGEGGRWGQEVIFFKGNLLSGGSFDTGTTTAPAVVMSGDDAGAAGVDRS